MKLGECSSFVLAAGSEDVASGPFGAGPGALAQRLSMALKDLTRSQIDPSRECESVHVIHAPSPLHTNGIVPVCKHHRQTRRLGIYKVSTESNVDVSILP